MTAGPQRVLLALTMLTALLVGGAVAKNLREGHSETLRVSRAAQVGVLQNKERQKRSLPLLRQDPVLAALARIHTRDMIRVGFFAHDHPQGQTFAERMAWLHRRLIGENLAWGTAGHGTAAGLVSLWMSSPSHRANLLRRGFRRVGCSVIVSEFMHQKRASVATCDFSS